MVGIGVFRVFTRIVYLLTKVGFFFIGPNSSSRAQDLAAVNYVTQAVVIVEDWVLKSG